MSQLELQSRLGQVVMMASCPVARTWLSSSMSSTSSRDAGLPVGASPRLVCDVAPRTSGRLRRNQLRSRPLRELSGSARPDHGERHDAVHLRTSSTWAETGSAGHRAAAWPDGRWHVGLLAARVRVSGRDGPDQRPGWASTSSSRRARTPPMSLTARTCISATGIEHHVRVPHPRPGPGALAGVGRGGADLPLPTSASVPGRRASSRRTVGPGPATSPRPRLLGAPARDLPARVVDERDRFYLAMLRQLGIEKGKPFAARRAPGCLLTAASCGRRADGAGQHVRQAVPRLPVLAGPAVGPRHRARQLRPARQTLRPAARARVLVLRGGQLLRGDEEPDPRRWAGLPRRLHRRRRRWLDGGATTPSTSRPTHRPSCSGPSRSTTCEPAA